jgi:hypothetical protein
MENIWFPSVQKNSREPEDQFVHMHAMHLRTLVYSIRSMNLPIHDILTPLPMVYQTPYPCYIDPLSMVYWTPYPWYFDPHDRIEYTSVLRCIACIYWQMHMLGTSQYQTKLSCITNVAPGGSANQIAEFKS